MAADHLIVRVRDDVKAKDVDARLARAGLQVVKALPNSKFRLVAWQGDPSGDARAAAAKLADDYPNLIVYAEPDYLLRAFDQISNDPYFIDGSLWGISKIGAPAAWDKTVGSTSVVVGVIDTGIDYTHEDLTANMWRNEGEDWNDDGSPGKNGVDDDGNGYVDDYYGIAPCDDDSDPKDDNGHGSHCAGTIGGVGNNAIGVVGVNWSVKLMALKFLNADGAGYSSDAIECIEYATAMGADLTSNSWGGGGVSEAMREAIENNGRLFVCAAGNKGVDLERMPQYPASYDCANILAVAATDADDSLASFSNYGFSTVDVAAPGVDILSCSVGGYATHSGTSMATPHVAGAAALATSIDANLAYRQLKALLMNSSDSILSLDGKCGSGRLNVGRAVNEGAINVTTPNGGERISLSSTQTITWDTILFDGSVKIELYLSGERVAVLSDDAVDGGTFDWTVSNELSISDGYAVRIVSLDDAIADLSDATFAIVGEPATLTVLIDPEASGTTTPSGEVTCYPGVPLTILGIPLAGYTFSSWTSDDQALVADDRLPKTTVTVTGDATVTACFQRHSIFFKDSDQSLGSYASEGVALGDLDGDGDLDLFVGNNLTSIDEELIVKPDKVWLNDGSGTFSNSLQSLGLTKTEGVALGDLDGDGDLDAFTAVYERDDSRVWLNDGTGTFSDSGQRLGDLFARDVALGDLDGDGDLDAFLVGILSNDVLWNDGTGIFSANGQTLKNEAIGWGVALGDLDGDGDLDAYVANSSGVTISPKHGDQVWLNDGTGNFSDSGQSLGNLVSTDVALDDLDGDGDLDVFIACGGDGSGNLVLFNDGTGVFSDSGQILGDDDSLCVALADFDGDGALDAFVGNKYTAKINRLYLNNGIGYFADSGLDLGTKGYRDAAADDVDGDGSPDIVVGKSGGNLVWINDKTPTYALVVNGGTGSGRFPAGTEIDIVAASESDKLFDHWSGDTDVLDDANDASATVTMPARDVAVTATFIDACDVTVNVDPEDAGYITSPDASQVPLGRDVSLRVHPRGDYAFQQWVVDGDAVIADVNAASTTAIFNGDCVVTATFLYDGETVQLTTRVSSDGAGDVSPDGATIVPINWPQSITATPADGNAFLKWDVFGRATVADSRASETEITLGGDAVVTARFIESGSAVTVTLRANDGGSVNPSGTIKAATGEVLEIMAEPNGGMVFSGWTLDAGEAAFANTNASISIFTPTTDAEVSANFTDETVGIEKRYPKINVKIDTRRSGGDSVRVLNAPMTLDAVGTDDEIAVLIDGKFFAITNSDLKQSTDRRSFRSKSGNVQLNLNFDAGLWSFNARKATLSDVLDNRDGVDVTLQVNDQLFGANYAMTEKIAFSFKSSENDSTPLETHGEAMNPFAIERASGTIVVGKESAEKLAIRLGSFTLPDGASFEAARDPITIQIDDYVFDVPAGSITERKSNRYSYQSGTAKLDLKFEGRTGEWNLRVSKSELAEFLFLGDGLDVQVELGTQATGGVTLRPTRKGTFIYKP